MLPLKHSVRQYLRAYGWEIHRFNPHGSLCNYLCSMVFPFLEINCVIDVGAHHGEYGAMLRRGGFAGHIISFEPVTESFEILQRMSSRDPYWTTYNYALSNDVIPEVINVTRGTDGSSFLQPSDFGSHAFPLTKVEHTEKVVVRRLDDIFSSITCSIEHPRVYLKLDTQGWDLEVFRGAQESLSCVMALQSEMSVQGIYQSSTDYRQALDIYFSSGFAISHMFPVSSDSQLRLVEFDCVMVRAIDCSSVRSQTLVGDTEASV